MRARARESRTVRRERELAFAAIALFMTCAVSLPILLVALSSRPDLYGVKPRPVKAGIAVLDWQTLNILLTRPVNEAATYPGGFGPEVEIAGYMIPIEPSESKERVGRFLLVPDPGDWLNPPHFHPGEVMDVRLRDGEKVRLIERTAVTVCGKLSLGSMESNPRAVFYLLAATVDSF